jgi:hypothetical protein
MNTETKKWIVANDKGLKSVGKFVKSKGANTYSFSSLDCINIGYDTKPDSDWGGNYTWRGRIIVTKEELFDPTCKAIEKALGWGNAS